MQYCLDTDVYIQAHRGYYAFDLVPGFWDALIDFAEHGLFCSPILVSDELIPKTPPFDALAQWARDHKTPLFNDVDNEIVTSYGEVADFVVHSYEPQHVQLFLKGADPWVIAHAKAKALTVVTMESRKNEKVDSRSGLISGRIKIPNVCEHFGIRHIDTFGFLRELGRSFR